ncbi:MAG: 1-deoxy-D-xylulose-5-phosphate synthase [Clostridiales bacterium]|nr:1-deoxy-D-xylulose-5-phosphate synthase [Clostridiales bacterium]
MTEYSELKILNTIKSPEDLKKLSGEELYALADEIRRYMITTVSKNGGHLASNLGVVEMTIALHKAFDFSTDRLVFDVGHQSYVHKLLTGRAEQFGTLRKKGGIAGFPKTAESPYDAFNTGHSSTSISAAIGIMRADALNGVKRSVVALIGDGALTGGMAYEALDDVGQQKLPLIVVLNDNEMSISGNVGGLSRHLAKMRSARGYRNFKRGFSKVLKHIPLVGSWLSDRFEGLKNRIKYFILPNVLFEELGFTYLGPIDGHDIETMTEVFDHAKKMDKPVVIHAITKKGRGYEPAEKNPEKFHGIGKFDESTGESKASFGNSAVFSDELCRLAADHKEIVAITAAMASGTGLDAFKTKYPDRFFDVGIAEQHAVTMAAGMATAGITPVFCVYSSFLQRGFDQLLHDVCLQDLKVVFGIDRAGLVGADGETHHGVYDISYLLTLPNMKILSPSSVQELRAALDWAALTNDSPCAVRYNRGVLQDREMTGDILSWECIKPFRSVCVVATGRTVETAIKVCEDLNVGLYNARSIRPMDESALSQLARAHYIITVEDGIVNDGFGTQVAANMCMRGSGAKVVTVGVPNRVIEQGSVSEQDEECGLSAEELKKTIQSLIGGIYA